MYLISECMIAQAIKEFFLFLNFLVVGVLIIFIKSIGTDNTFYIVGR